MCITVWGIREFDPRSSPPCLFILEHIYTEKNSRQRKREQNVSWAAFKQFELWCINTGGGVPSLIIQIKHQAAYLRKTFHLLSGNFQGCRIHSSYCPGSSSFGTYGRPLSSCSWLIGWCCICYFTWDKLCNPRFLQISQNALGLSLFCGYKFLVLSWCFFYWKTVANGFLFVLFMVRIIFFHFMSSIIHIKFMVLVSSSTLMPLLCCHKFCSLRTDLSHCLQNGSSCLLS